MCPLLLILALATPPCTGACECDGRRPTSCRIEAQVIIRTGFYWLLFFSLARTRRPSGDGKPEFEQRVKTRISVTRNHGYLKHDLLFVYSCTPCVNDYTCPRRAELSVTCYEKKTANIQMCNRWKNCEHSSCNRFEWAAGLELAPPACLLRIPFLRVHLFYDALQ